MSKRLIDLQHITKSFDGQTVLDDLNLYIRENEFLTLLGPSGCGKTTTLRIIGGFETPDTGNVIFDGKNITNLKSQRTAAQYGFPEICIVPPYVYCRKHCLWLKNQKRKAKHISTIRLSTH